MRSKMSRTQMKHVYVNDDIRRYRNELCYTQAYMAAQLGIAQSTYQRIENGEITITMDRLENIASILKIPLNTFLIADGSKIISGATGKSNYTVINISEHEWNLMQKLLADQEKRIAELETKVARRDEKIEQLKLKLIAE